MSTQERSFEDFVRVGSVDDFEDGVLYNHKIAGKHVAVVRNRDRFYAMLNACTHSGFFLAPGRLDERDRIYCRAHGAYFRVSDGKPLLGPPNEPLEMYEVRVEGDEVFVAPPV